jgi:hypothetical protein
VGYVFLIFALGIAAGVALMAPRAALVVGAIMFVAGAIPVALLIALQPILGHQINESYGMLATLCAFYISAPGLMLLALSLLFGLGR